VNSDFDKIEVLAIIEVTVLNNYIVILIRCKELLSRDIAEG